MTSETRDLPMLFKNYIEEPFRFQQLAEALPAHIKPERMARLAMTAFNNSQALRDCRPESIFSAILLAAQVGLEIGVDGQAYLVPYKGTCTFVPGWKGIVDIVMRGGRATVWTGAVYVGDEFDYALGSSPFVQHRPARAGKKDRELDYTYAIGAITGTDKLVIEVWPREQLEEHFDANNKVGAKHYRYKFEEMYFRKVPLLQVCKYMPKSIELTNVLTAAYAAENHDEVRSEGGVIYVDREDDQPGQERQPEDVVRQPQRARRAEPADVSDAAVKTSPSAPVYPTNASNTQPLATETERNWVKRKAGDGFAHLLEDAGITDFDHLTKAGLAKCRNLLNGQPA
ncbi:recombinase RecT [Variovorax sp. 278MFTsu5.1]|uniref:recombinase RecT n=1 Tax=Variovorax sp. 278MFTsu5.1 TaxID=3158366 RepID=UPI003AAB514B